MMEFVGVDYEEFVNRMCCVLVCILVFWEYVMYN